MKLSDMPDHTVIEIELTHHPFLNNEDGTPLALATSSGEILVNLGNPGGRANDPDAARHLPG